MTPYRLINEYDGNDTIDFQVKDGEDPCSAALEVLGWTLVVAKELEEDYQEEQ